MKNRTQRTQILRIPLRKGRILISANPSNLCPPCSIYLIEIQKIHDHEKPYHFIVCAHCD